MVPIASEESTGPEGAGAESAEPLRRAVQVALAIYLMPVVAIVCAIGAASIALEKAAGFASRFATVDRRGEGAGLRPVVRPGPRPTASRARRRIRVGR